MVEAKAAKLSPVKWILGVVVFVVVVGALAMLGMWFSSGTVGTPADANNLSGAEAIGLAIIGVITMVLGEPRGYLIVVFTDCFTSNFQLPVFDSFRRNCGWRICW